MTPYEINVAALNQKIADAVRELHHANNALIEYTSRAEFHVYESLDAAQAELEEKLRDEAANDCEGSGNCGNEEYTHEFTVDGKRYEAKLAVEYDRHDKRYYYICDSTYSAKEILA